MQNNDQKDENLCEEVKVMEDQSSLELNEEAKTFPLEYVKKLRQECSRYRTALKELKEFYEEFSPESVDEYKALKEASVLRDEEESKKVSEDKNSKISEVIMKAAKEMKAVSPMQVAALLKERVDIDEEGVAFVLGGDSKSVEEFVKGFLGENLHLVKSKSNRIGANTLPSAKNIFSLEQVSSMTAEQYSENRDRILKSLSKSG
ncbi:hypothetical protein ACFL2A_00585 [Thermodesulfobacteriota bacterium]